jgi:hypothetical protein
MVCFFVYSGFDSFRVDSRKDITEGNLEFKSI